MNKSRDEDIVTIPQLDRKPYNVSTLEIIKRIAERGKAFAERAQEYSEDDNAIHNNSRYIDLFQHILDELQRIKL